MAKFLFKSANRGGLNFIYSKEGRDYRWDEKSWSPKSVINISLPPFQKNQTPNEAIPIDRYSCTYTVHDDVKELFIEGLMNFVHLSMTDENGEEMLAKYGAKQIYIKDISADLSKAVRKQQDVLKARLKIEAWYNGTDSLKEFYDLAWMLGESTVGKEADDLYLRYCEIADKTPQKINKLILDDRTLVEVLIAKGKKLYMDSISDYMVAVDGVNGRVKFFDNLDSTFVNEDKLVETLLLDNERREFFIQKVSEMEMPILEKLAANTTAKKPKPTLASKKIEEETSVDTMDATQLKLLWKETLSEARSDKSDRIAIIKRLHEILDKHLQLNPLQDMINVNKHYDDVMMEVFSSARYSNKKMDWMFEEVFAKYSNK
jgi:hypothetical protein